VRKNTNLAIFGTLKFGIGNLLLFGLLFKILMATLGDFSVYFVVRKLLILAYCWAKNKEKNVFFSLKLVGILKCVKIREFPEFLKFITLKFSIRGRCISFCRHLEDTLFRPTFTLSFAGQWPLFSSIGQCPACFPCSSEPCSCWPAVASMCSDH